MTSEKIILSEAFFKDIMNKVKEFGKTLSAFLTFARDINEDPRVLALLQQHIHKEYKELVRLSSEANNRFRERNEAGAQEMAQAAYRKNEELIEKMLEFLEKYGTRKQKIFAAQALDSDKMPNGAELMNIIMQINTNKNIPVLPEHKITIKRNVLESIVKEEVQYFIKKNKLIIKENYLINYPNKETK